MSGHWSVQSHVIIQDNTLSVNIAITYPRIATKLYFIFAKQEHGLDFKLMYFSANQAHHITTKTLVLIPAVI
jgi:hypothetical protein